MAIQTAHREYYIDKIHEQGFASLAVPLSPADMASVMTDFQEVSEGIFDCPTERSQDLVDAFAVSSPDRPGDSRGFINQRRVGQINQFEIGRGPGTDNKDVLHFTPLTQAHALEYMRSRGGVPRAMRRLLEHCTDIHQTAVTAVRPAFEALGIDTLMLAPERQAYENIHIVRLIRYLGTVSTEENVSVARDSLAQLHFDRSKFTAALWESASGLVGTPGNNAYGDPSLTLEEFDATAAAALASPIKHYPGILKLFAGAGYNRLPKDAQTASGELPLLLHGVVDDNPGIERKAIVVFLNEHAGVTTSSVPPASETDLAGIRNAVEARQRRHGGLVA